MARKRRMPVKKAQRVRARRVVAEQILQSRNRRVQTWRVQVFLALLLVLAVALRLANLTTQSLWADEGNSVRLTERPLGLVLDAARADVHPPGYYLLLWGWVRLFGSSEPAVRLLSVAIGVALVGLIYLLGKHLFGARAAWLAAFCAAVSPLQIQYSQEVRMYILVALFAAGATYAFARWIQAWQAAEKGSWRWQVLYVLAAAGGLWAHYSFPIVILALNAAWLVWWLGRRSAPGQGKAIGWWVGMQAAALVLYLPWLSIAWGRITAYGPISEPYSVPSVFAQGLKLLSVGETVPEDDLTRWLTVGMVGLAVFGAWGGFAPAASSPSLQRTSRVYTWALILSVLAPMVMMAALVLTGRPAYRPKFFLVASPAFCLLVGLGIALLERPLSQSGRWSSRLWLLLGLVVVGAGAARSLRYYYLDPAYARSDYRGIGAYIESIGREGDAILLNAPNQWEVFTYYYKGPIPVYPVCRSRPPIQAEVEAELSQITATHSRILALYWAVQESDPERIVERWLEQRAFKASDEWYGDVRFVIYALPEEVGTVEMREPLSDVRLGDQIALRGFTLHSDALRPGDVLQVTLFWEALQAPQSRYKVFLHLVDEGGQILSQYDDEPGDGMDPTSSWKPERGVFGDRYGLLVPMTAPEGTYRLLVGLYHVEGAPRLPIAIAGEPAGDALTLATVGIRQ